MAVRFWTNSSVLAFAGDKDPEQAVVERAQEMALQAMSEGWPGPPYDPFELADRLGVQVVARDDLYDARTVAGRGDRLVLEYNPSRPRGRVRYSVAHEVAHMLFPDAHERVRYRSDPEGVHGDGWQLEMLCNIAAGELLMPAGTFPELTSEALDIENLMSLRGKYDVSTEALLLRVARLSGQPATMFAASRVDPDAVGGPLRLDYWRGTRAWTAKLRKGSRIRKGSAVYDCTAVGYTARGDEEWSDEGEMHVEAVGIPAYPGQRLPRVVGLLRPRGQVTVASHRRMQYVTGNATQPRGTGLRLIAHVVNDRTANWGGGFARALRDVHPAAQDGFRRWARASKSNLRLGNVHFAHVEDDLVVASMVAQRGYGAARTTRLRYDALNTALTTVAAYAAERQAAVHMPRIGAGMAGGDWQVIAELVAAALVAHDVEAIVYSLPGEDWRPHRPEQQTL
jgi:O-acetyl-ADP-ribose deacetylase (regulator of RNase III)